MAWEDKAPAEPCVPPKQDANADGLLERLSHRVSQQNQEGSATTPTACQVPQQ